jgi:hypothetical protein
VGLARRELQLIYSTCDASIGLRLGLFEKLSTEKPTEEKNQQSDHDRCADEFGQRELPAQERQHIDAELMHAQNGPRARSQRLYRIMALS